MDSASNGREGIEKFMAGWFDLVITDRPCRRWAETSLPLPSSGIAPAKPIIMLTGFGELMAAKGEKPAGVKAVVSKPVTLDALRQAIAQATERAAAKDLSRPAAQGR